MLLQVTIHTYQPSLKNAVTPSLLSSMGKVNKVTSSLLSSMGRVKVVTSSPFLGIEEVTKSNFQSSLKHGNGKCILFQSFLMREKGK